MASMHLITLLYQEGLGMWTKPNYGRLHIHTKECFQTLYR